MDKCERCSRAFDEIILGVGFCKNCGRAYIDNQTDELIKQKIKYVDDYRKRNQALLFELRQKSIPNALDEKELVILNAFTSFESNYNQFKNNLDDYSKPPEKYLNKDNVVFRFPFADYIAFIRSISEICKIIESER